MVRVTKFMDDPSRLRYTVYRKIDDVETYALATSASLTTPNDAVSSMLSAMSEKCFEAPSTNKSKAQPLLGQV